LADYINQLPNDVKMVEVWNRRIFGGALVAQMIVLNGTGRAKPNQKKPQTPENKGK
jgi:hypothetical protein